MKTKKAKTACFAQQPPKERKNKSWTHFNPEAAEAQGLALKRYSQILNIIKYGGGRDEAETYLTYWDIPACLHEFILAYAEYQALRMEVYA